MDAQRTAHLKDKQSARGAGGHVHSHGVATNMGGKLVVALVLTSLFVIGEFIAGLIANSLALVSDAGHNLTDALAVGFSLWAMSLAKKKPTPDKTFGYYRAGILAAALNAGTLVIIALFIFYEGVTRLLHPEPVEGGIIIVVAAVAVVLNGAIAFMLSAGSDDLNVRSTFVHMAGDALSAVGVIIAGVGILLTGWQFLDPLVSFFIGLFILWTSWGIVREAVNILMEGTPAGLNMGQLIADMNSVPGVNTVHDVHVWTIGHDGRWDVAYESQRNVSMPPDLVAALEQNERVKKTFDLLDKSGQYAVILPILKAITADGRTARLQKAIAKLEARDKNK
jgi:cobalt-zinc-cadmium efflux system protein